MPTDLQKQHQDELREKRDKLMMRKSRTRRLIQHGAIAEAFVQGSEDMEPETFKEELQKLISPTGRRIPKGPERSDTTICGKELRTSHEVTLSPALTMCLSREGYSSKDLERLLELTKCNLERVPDGGTIRVRSKVDTSRMIFIKRINDVLEVI